MIEDDEAVRALFRAILEPAGYLVWEAVDARDGIRRFRESPTDLVITDMEIPAVGGSEVVRELRADYPILKILAVSGFMGSDESSEVRRLGADAMLSKPVGVEELREVVAGLLGTYKQTSPR